MKTIENISMLGLGKLGLPTLVFLASHGCKAIGADLNKNLIHDLNNGIVTSDEPDLRDTFLKHRDNINVTTSIEQAIAASNISFIIVPTPSVQSGEFSTELVVAVATQIGDALRSRDTYHLVVLVSTVMPGDTRKNVLELIEQRSGKTCGKDFGVCYSPEFIALGSVLHNLAHPDFILIGQSDDRAGDYMESFHNKILPDVPKRRMSLENAELAKIAVNTYVTTKISYANMLAEICENVPSLDVDVVTKAIGLDKRIGARYLNAGLGYGGPCFPRDNKALSTFARNVGARAHLAIATDEVNHLQANRLVGRINDIAAKKDGGKKVSVIGISYKKDTDVIEQSQGIMIAQGLAHYKNLYTSVSIFDNANALVAAEKALKKDEVNFIYSSSLTNAVNDADIIIIAVPDKKFIPEFSMLKNKGSGVLIVDPWRLFTPETLPQGADYCTVGKSMYP